MSGRAPVLLGFGAVTLALLLTDAGPASWLRHLYLLPTLGAALRFGSLGGWGGGLLAALLEAPFVLPAIERGGLTAEAAEGLVSLGLFLFVGSVTGSLSSRARHEAGRSHLLATLQRSLGGEGGPAACLGEAAEQLRSALGARAVAIALASNDGELVATALSDGAAAPHVVAANSAAGHVLREGRRLFVSDLESDSRFGPAAPSAAPPRRVLLVPLSAREGPIGVLAVERRGEFGRELRATVETLALQLALGIENARLAARQRRFAAELEEKIAVATERLRELDRAKSEFVSIVSHELRTPLTSIQGFSELLLTRPIPAAEARQCLATIHREAERLGRIVTDLLDLSRIESGRQNPLVPEPLELGPLITANAELFRSQSEAHAIECEIAEALPPVLADRDGLDRVLKNLLSNAIKYSPGGGVVRILAGVSAEDGERVELVVEDQGVGIPAEALPRIFARYARVPHPATGHVRGLGLGLALVKSLVEAQGGRVRVESEVGTGSRFIVSLPIA